MSGRDFNMISPAIWGSERFASLSRSAKLLLLYVMTSPHQTSAGGYRLPAGYAAEDTGCGADEFAADLDELVSSGLILHDPETKEVYVSGWFKKCPPANQRHATGAQRLICNIASDRLREQMEADFAETTWGAKATAPAAEIHPFDASKNSLTDTDYMRRRAVR